ncbi:XRE family transcriptional regulator [Rhodophyticola sp. CCM32]|uniref:helix-turn-helix domain-containing protein n=1 Tax=Rhodophyticola sp. CCM32 TaxID=2916397 RepID=UPI00107F6FEA|nr:XRE family transcriptional regulator [Rhodophyticola sp. CCM32]QBY00317.1 XRE family transcriptional regulator [Rhodophyticola sp. CCM32]
MDLEQKVGDAVRLLRTSQTLTLAEFSKKSGVSTAMISKIERGQVSASLSTLEALAASLGVPIANLFATTVERKEVSYVKANHGIEMRRSGSTYGHTYQLIGSAAANGSEAKCYLITIEETAEGQPMFLHPGIEFIHMMKGKMTYCIGNDRYPLSPGDSITFDSEMPHGPEGLSGGPVTFLTVILE